MTEADIIYQRGNHWVLKGRKGYELVRLSAAGTHGEVVGWYGSQDWYKERAIADCDKREAARVSGSTNRDRRIY